MICYRDRAWCVRSMKLCRRDTGLVPCTNTECDRFLTNAEGERNKHRLPIAWADLYTEDCGAVLECVE